MRISLFLLIFCVFAFANDEEVIFSQKTEQILREFEKLEAFKTELESYRRATNELFNQRQAQLLQKEADLNKTLEIIAQKELELKDKFEEQKKSLQALIDKNEAILNEIKGLNEDKMLEAYVKMKDNKVAQVLENMPSQDAAKLLYRMQAKKISAVLSKMDTQKAIELTTLIKEGKIFDDNVSLQNAQEAIKENF